MELLHPARSAKVSLGGAFKMRSSCRIAGFLILFTMSSYIFMWQQINVLSQEQGKLELFQERPTTSKNITAKKLNFLFWADFSIEEGASFLVDLALEIRACGHEVFVESPVDGVVLQQLDAKYDFGVVVNPTLQKLISGLTSFWSALGDTEHPHVIIFFSSVWCRALRDLHFELAYVPARLVWYYYEAGRQYVHKDQDQRKVFYRCSQGKMGNQEGQKLGCKRLL